MAPQVLPAARTRRATEQARLCRSRRMLEKAGCKRVVIYVWQPKFGRALDLVATTT